MSTTFSMTDHPHRRRNALTGEWILVSPHRNKRPWQGQVEKTALEQRPSYDPDCYLCPGNERAGGLKNPAYAETFVFTNDFAALLTDTPDYQNPDVLFQTESVKGTSRVLCFSPRHDLTLAEMDVPAIGRVVDMWASQVTELSQRYRWVHLCFEASTIFWRDAEKPGEPVNDRLSSVLVLLNLDEMTGVVGSVLEAVRYWGSETEVGASLLFASGINLTFTHLSNDDVTLIAANPLIYRK